MIQEIEDIYQYLDWIDTLCVNTSFIAPFCDKERIISLSKKENNLFLASYENGQLMGVFGLLLLKQEQYIETLFLYATERMAYEDLLDYLKIRYQNYELWFVYHPNNANLSSYLKEKQVFFYPEQKAMEYNGAKIEDNNKVIPYCDCYKDEYITIHSKDSYYDGEKVLSAIDDFHIYLCSKNNHLVGYIDVSNGDKTNEVMDLLVLPKYRNQGCGTSLLKKAIANNNNNRLILTVDTDNAAAFHLYEKVGFVETPSDDSVTAKLVL